MPVIVDICVLRNIVHFAWNIFIDCYGESSLELIRVLRFLYIYSDCPVNIVLVTKIISQKTRYSNMRGHTKRGIYFSSEEGLFQSSLSGLLVQIPCSKDLVEQVISTLLSPGFHVTSVLLMSRELTLIRWFPEEDGETGLLTMDCSLCLACSESLHI